jgi:hypothetical protein
MSDRDKEGRAVSGEGLNDVLASIRALVTAETSCRMEAEGESADVLMLTPDMRVEGEDAGEETEVRSGDVLAEGLDLPVAEPARGAPILDEEAIRSVVNRIVREELQGELGDRITRNLRKLIRREISQIEAERRAKGE